MELFVQQVRWAIRSLRRTPGFTLISCATLALGIGLSVAVFTIADALLLRRLPVRDQDRIVLLAGQSPDQRIEGWPLGFESAREFAGDSRALSRVAYFGYEGAAAQTVVDGGQSSRVNRALVSGEYFGVLGADPLIGRALQTDDDFGGAEPVAVLSHRGWQNHFGGATDVVGRRLSLHEAGVTYTIVGVMPRGVDYPRSVDFWAAIQPSTSAENLPRLAYYAIGRLAPGVTVAQARDELTAHYRRPDAPAGQPNLEGTARTLPDIVIGDTRPAVVAFAAAAALLLLITCINVANLLLVRGLARMREIAVRSALGAGRRLVAQLLAENAILAVIGGAFGLAVAAGAVRLFVLVAPADLPRVDEIHLSSSALLGALAITGIATLLFGLAPAVATSRVELQQVLRSGTRRSAGRRSRRATEGLVAVQVALAVLVLSAAGLIGRSLIALERADLAFDPSRLLIAQLGLRTDTYDAPAKQLAMLERVLPAIGALPGVRAVSPVVAVPFSGTHGWDGRPTAHGQTAEEAAANPMLNMEIVMPNYFATIGAPVSRGRGFTDADREGAPRVVILSESAARHYWPAADPIGRRLAMGPNNEFTVVGIVPDTRYRDLRDARASIYFPLRQSFFPFAPTNLVIRTEGAAARVVPALQQELEETAPGVTLASVAPFETFLAKPLAQPRLNALLLGLFAVAAVALAAIGLFGVLATMVRQRTREFGVRRALGATASDVRRMVLRRGMAVAAIGLSLGVAGALAANRLLAALLFQVSPTDPLTLSGIVLVLLAVAAVASLIPARASTRIEPVIALRSD